MAILYANKDVAARQHPVANRHRRDVRYAIAEPSLARCRLSLAPILHHDPVMRYVLTLCVMLTFAGCGSRPLSHAPAESHARPGRTTVFGAPESPYRMREPWFTDRNDARPTVAAGVESPIFQHSTTRTYDHTFSHDGDVEDRYYRTRIDVRHRSTTQ